MFANPAAVYDQVRAPMLGIDTRNPGVGPIIGMPYWNVDLSAQKNFRVWSHATVQLSFIFTNVFNHNVLFDPGLSLGQISCSGSATGCTSGWGTQTAQGNTPRKIEYGIRTSW